MPLKRVSYTYSSVHSFNVFFVVDLNKQSSCWWLETTISDFTAMIMYQSTRCTAELSQHRCFNSQMPSHGQTIRYLLWNKHTDSICPVLVILLLSDPLCNTNEQMKWVNGQTFRKVKNKIVGTPTYFAFLNFVSLFLNYSSSWSNYVRVTKLKQGCRYIYWTHSWWTVYDNKYSYANIQK